MLWWVARLHITRIKALSDNISLIGISTLNVVRSDEVPVLL